MTTQTYTSQAKERREELKAISQPLKPLVKEGAYETLNAAIIAEFYKKGDNQEFKTFEQWKKEGYSIKKGSRAFVVWGKPRKLETAEPIEGEEEKEFFPICYLFSNAQVYRKNEQNDSTAEEPEALYGAFAEVQLSYKRENTIEMRTKVAGSQDAFENLLPLFREFIDHREAFAILLLDRANKILGFAEISKGGVAGTVADPRLIFQAAILSNASGIILAHNHPSGNAKASEADLRLTRKLKEGALLFDIQVLDHIILLSENAYLSFADEGIL